MASYFYGWETLCELAIEDPLFYGRTAPSAAFNGFAHLRSAVVEVNENTSWDMSIGGATKRKPQTTSKLGHEPKVSLAFWLPDDLDATALDVWFLKLGLDAYNVAHDGTKWVVPNTGASVYGSDDLHSFNVEIGHNKSGNIRAHHILGCVVDEMTIEVKKNENVLVTLDSLGKIGYMNQSSYTNGSATRSTAKPLSWANCEIEYGNDGSTITRSDFTALSITFGNGLIRNYDIFESSFLVDALDATTGWSASTDGALSTNSTIYKEGAGSVSLRKTGTSSTELSMTKTITAIDGAGKIGYLWVYIADASTLTTLDVSAAANNHVKLGTGGVTNYNQYNMGVSLAAGWNLITLNVDSPDTTGGSGADETLIDTVKIQFKTDASGDTIAADKIILDHLRVVTPRSCSNMIVGPQKVTGSFTINMTTTSGMQLYNELYGDSSDPLEPTNAPTNKEIILRIKNLSSPTTQKIEFDLRNVVVGQIPMEIDPEKVQEIEVPYMAQYYAMSIYTPDTSAISNWDDQS